MAVITISTTISAYMHEKAKTNGINWNEALRVGIGVLLAEKGDLEYCGELNIYRKIERLSEKLTEQTEQNEKLATALRLAKENLDLKEQMRLRE